MKFVSLTGLVPYETARELQRKLVDLRAAGEIEDTVLFLEHDPVITRGRGLQFTGVVDSPRHMPLPQVLPLGVSFAETERGGDLTYHGPGQLVVYPIVKLDGTGFGPRNDVGGYLRRFEQVLVLELENMGLAAQARPSATGVWVGERKLASVGIAVRRWVTFHGMAINCVNDLKPFHFISPCGFSPEVMIRLDELVPAFGLENKQWRSNLEERLSARMFRYAPLELSWEREPEIERMTIADALAMASAPVRPAPVNAGDFQDRREATTVPYV